MGKRKRKTDIKIRIVCTLAALGLYGAMHTEFCGVVVGALLAGVGMLALWWMRKGGGVAHKGITAYVGIVLCVMGSGMLVASIGSALLVWRKDIDFGIFGLGLGMLLLVVPVIDVYKFIVCKECIEVRCAHVMTMRARYAVELYSPIYEFEWEGKSYRTQSGKTYSKRKSKWFGVGRKCYIYIDPKNPMLCCEDKKLSLLSVFACVLGIFLVHGGMGQILYGVW